MDTERLRNLGKALERGGSLTPEAQRELYNEVCRCHTEIEDRKAQFTTMNGAGLNLGGQIKKLNESLTEANHRCTAAWRELEDAKKRIADLDLHVLQQRSIIAQLNAEKVIK